ncbi:RPII140-upstream gene protein isoform X1 [Hydra vulgaris]|uniref:RPII140-upstream gene protein isoform X1 n=1 Tax=Hydra vulgaris TaxID=6087 RepID=UPI00019255B6|nr:RPII140-upstream gene protein [Hydra vulgaris]XP_047140172.1 RPII140-upstream gene protein [Hydra vulgaris]
MSVPENEGTIKKILKIFTTDSQTGLRHPKALLVDQSILAGCLAGFFIGGRIGGRVGAVEHIENTKLEVYQSVTHAHRQYHGRVILGFVKNGCKFGWRAGLFSGFYSFVMVVLSEITNTNDNVNLIGAAAVTGVVYNCFSGWRKMIVGAILGTGMSLPFAGLIEAVRFITPEDKKAEINVFKILNYQPVVDDKPTLSSLDVGSVINDLQISLADLNEINLPKEVERPKIEMNQQVEENEPCVIQDTNLVMNK